MDNHNVLENLTDLLLMSDEEFYFKYLKDSTAEELLEFLELCPDFLNESIAQDPFNTEIDEILQHIITLFEKAS